MERLFYPWPWMAQDLIILVAGLGVLCHAARGGPEKIRRILLEGFAFCFCYAALYENGAAAYLGLIAALWARGRSSPEGLRPGARAVTAA